MTQPTELHPLITKTRETLKQIGYQDALLLPNYSFSDVLGDRDEARTVLLAAFAQEPASYKTACFGVALTQSDDPHEVEYYRALGAPVVIALREDTNNFHLWKMMAQGLPEVRGEFPVDALSEVLRARNIAFPSVSPQLDFYDVGLVAAIEADVHRKLNELLGTVVAQSLEIYRERHGQEPESLTYRALFQIIFRFMAAKMLGDRKHPGDWLNPDALNVLQAVNTFYNDPAAVLPTLDAPIRNRAWDTIRTAIHFQNLSVEALAYVYENTFVDITTRHTLGTHATPYEVAEYMVRALPIEKLPQDERTVFEPFCGAAPFLIAALGRLRELLPSGMDAAERHSYFVRMLTGMEMDPFAREVAFHSLILADYPNSNGWSILEEDVFTSPQLEGNLARANVVFCNPPYGPWSALEKRSHPSRAANKAVEALSRVLQHPPKMLGFVLPRVYVNGKSYRKAREQLGAHYGNVDVIMLPGTVFQHSQLETAVVLAYGDPKSQARLRSVSLSAQGYDTFKYSRAVEWEKRSPERLWEELESLPTLSSMAEVHRGMEYNIPFEANYSRLVSDVEVPGYRAGLVRARGASQPFTISAHKYLNTDESLMLYSSHKLDWTLPKLVAPAGRTSRGQWLMTASIDYDGLLCIQRFHGIWPKVSAPPLEVLAAILNGPVANMWLYQHRTGRDNQVGYVKGIPMPTFLTTTMELITRYVNRYMRFQGTAEAINLLLKIDAAVLDAYGLSEEAESELLAWFDGAWRPGVPNFTGYGPEYKKARAEYQQELMTLINQRRVELIGRKGRTSTEQQELDELKAKMSAYVNARHPLPFPALERLEEFSRQLKANKSQ